MIEFDYILRGYEVDEYCDILINKYGETSNIAQKLDEEYYNLVNSSKTYVEQLNAIRRFLCDSNYTNEIEYADSVFIPILEKRFDEVSKYSGLTDLELRQKVKEKQK